MMDFGAIQCTPQSPKCLLCPLAETCVALREGRVEELPVKLKTLKVQTRRLNYIYIRCNGEIAIHRRGEGDIWQGLWEPYNVSDLSALPTFDAPLVLKAKDVKHVLTHRILLADFYLLETKIRPLLPDDYIWIKESEISEYGIPRLIEILLEKL